MEVLPLHAEIVEYLKAHKLSLKFRKQILFIEKNLRHPGLEVEILEPKRLKIYSFRVDKKYRAIFIFRNSNTIEVIDVNNHYR